MTINDEVWRYDAVELRMDSHSIDPDTGWMRVEAVIGRGDVVLPYLNSDGSIRREFRPSSEVFSAESMASFDGVPLTNEHPPVHLDADTAKQFTVGSISTPRREGDLLVANVLVTDAGMVRDILGGKRQLSPGYRIRPDASPGEFRGKRFDLIQRGPKGNHVAGVDQGRQGKEVALRMDSGDAVIANINPKEANVPGQDDKQDKQERVTVRIDGQDITVDPTTAAVLEGIEKDRKTNADKLAEVEAARKDGDDKLAELQAKVDGLIKKDEPDPPPDLATMAARIDAREAAHKVEIEAVQAKAREDVAELELRLDVVATAKAMNRDFKPANADGSAKSRSDVMVEVIAQVLGDEAKAQVEAKDTPGYTEAFYEQALQAHSDSKNHGAKLLTIAKGAKTEPRGDVAGDAKRKADKRHQTAWKDAK